MTLEEQRQVAYDRNDKSEIQRLNVLLGSKVRKTRSINEIFADAAKKKAAK